MSEKLARGWRWPPNSRKAHYFLAGELISLCGKWMYSGPAEDDHHANPSNCRACMKKRERLAVSCSPGGDVDCTGNYHHIDFDDVLDPTGSTCSCGRLSVMATIRDPHGRLVAIGMTDNEDE